MVTVIVPTYNYGRFIGAAISSLQRQTLAAWECVVVDDGSTDQTEAVVRQLAAADDRIAYLRQPNRGMSAARNAGLGRAIGRYVQFLDADDALQPRKLEAHAAHLDRHPEHDIVHGGWGYWEGVEDVVSDPTAPSAPPLAGAGRDVIERLLEGNSIAINAALVRTARVTDIGGFSETVRAHEDWEFWLRLALRGCRFAPVLAPHTLALVRRHHSSVSRDRLRMLEGLVDVRRRIGGELEAPWQRELNRRLLGEAEVWLGTRMGVHESLSRGVVTVARGVWHRRSPLDLLRLLALPVAATPPGRRLGRRLWPGLFSDGLHAVGPMSPKERDDPAASA